MRTDMTLPDVSDLQNAIATARAAYLEARKTLDITLAGHKISGQGTDELLAIAEEYGPHNVFALLARKPSPLEIVLPATAETTLTPLLTRTVDADYALGSLLAKRENMLCAADPTRQRRYNLQGREFIFDVTKGTMTFLDDPTHPVHANLRRGQPASQPEPGLKLPPKGKGDRQR
jgi:hypothetical protein